VATVRISETGNLKVKMNTLTLNVMLFVDNLVKISNTRLCFGVLSEPGRYILPLYVRNYGQDDY
jgi:hypothetical protein